MHLLNLLPFAAVALAADPAKPAYDFFTPSEVFRNTTTALNLTVTEACKHDGTFTLSFWLSDNAREMGFLYPAKLDKFNVTVAGAKQDKSLDAFAELATIETEAAKISAAKYIGLNYTGSVLAHQDLVIPFKFTTLDQAGFINFTFSSRCEHESKDDVLYSAKGNFTAPKLKANSQRASLSAALLFACLSFILV